MKSKLSFSRFSNAASTRLAVWLVMAGLMSLPWFGCGKKPGAASAKAVPLAFNSPVLHDPVVQANLRELNANLAKCAGEHGMPESFEEMVRITKIQVPPPPPGTCYLLFSGSVTLGGLKAPSPQL